MKKVSIILTLVLVLTGGAMGIMAPAAQAQIMVPGPPQAVAAPWTGPNTPWVFYRGDWFMNGVLYYFYGNQNAWAPYYAYPPTYIVRPTYWYAPRWESWYKAHPTYWTNFQRRYPYWQGHNVSRHYDMAFYNKYHHGQGAGWQKGFHGGPHNPGPAPGHNRQPGAMGPGHGAPPPGQPGHLQPGQSGARQSGHYQPGQPAQKQPGQYQPGTAQKQLGQRQPGAAAQKQPGQYHPGPVQKQPTQPGAPAAKQPAPGRGAPQPHKPGEEPGMAR